MVFTVWYTSVLCHQSSNIIDLRKQLDWFNSVNIEKPGWKFILLANSLFTRTGTFVLCNSCIQYILAAKKNGDIHAKNVLIAYAPYNSQFQSETNKRSLRACNRVLSSVLICTGLSFEAMLMQLIFEVKLRAKLSECVKDRHAEAIRFWKKANVLAI